MRRILLAASAAIALQNAAAADVAVEVTATDGPAAALRLSLPEGLRGPIGVVIVLPDSLGADMRAQPYLDRLASFGLATLEIELADPAPGDPMALVPLPAQYEGALAQALGYVAGDPRLAANGVGLLGFGAGARAILASGGGRRAVALYPGCDFALNPAQGPVLLIHGEAEEGAAACSANVLAAEGGAVLALRGQTAGWDVPAPTLSGAQTLWPHPSGQGRTITRPSDRATAVSAEAALSWLMPLRAGER
jgi:dienelactone hydrolase